MTTRMLVCDMQGLPAVLEIQSPDEFPPRFYGSVSFIKNMDTGEVVKELYPGAMRYIEDAPKAKPLLASTRIGFELFGEQAMVWRVGFIADNGFSVPPSASLRPYIVRNDVKRASSLRDFFNQGG